VAKEQESLDPILKFKGVPYQDNESTGTVLNESGKQLERDVAAAIRAVSASFRCSTAS